MSTYITTVLAGPYFKAEDHWSGTLADGTALEVPLALYCRQSMAASFDTGRLFQLTKQGLGFFNDLFDYPYPWGKRKLCVYVAGGRLPVPGTGEHPDA
jgi:aminopeptidase N